MPDSTGSYPAPSGAGHPLEESEIFFLEDTADPDELVSVSAYALGREKNIILLNTGEKTNEPSWKYLQYQSERRKIVYEIVVLPKDDHWIKEIETLVQYIQETRSSIKFTLRLSLGQYEHIHEVSEGSQMTKADLVRDAINKYLGKKPNKKQALTASSEPLAEDTEDQLPEPTVSCRANDVLG